MINVYGFGQLQDDIVAVRTLEQSYTCREKRAMLTIVNDSREDVAFVRLDGGFYPDGNACDYSISNQMARSHGFLLELKGRHMNDAIGQLANTLLRLKVDTVDVCYRQACVVSSGAQKIPSGGWEKVQHAFWKQHHVRLVRYPNHSQIEFSKLAR